MKTSPHPRAEWAPHAAVWPAWPADPEVWPPGNVEGAREEVAAMIRALAAPGPAGRKGDRMRVLVSTREARETAAKALGKAAELVDARYGDIWLRDTGPIFNDPRQ